RVAEDAKLFMQQLRHARKQSAKQIVSCYLPSAVVLTDMSQHERTCRRGIHVCFLSNFKKIFPTEKILSGILPSYMRGCKLIGAQANQNKSRTHALCEEPLQTEVPIVIISGQNKVRSWNRFAFRCLGQHFYVHAIEQQ